MSQVAHQARAYPSFLSVKQLGVFPLAPGWNVSPSQGYLSGVERGTVRVKCLAEAHNTLSPFGAQTWTARSVDERTDMRPICLRTFFFLLTNQNFERKGLAYIATVWFLETPLSVAVTKDNACEMVVTLVNGGALLDYRTKEGLTPLHRAAASGKAMSVKVFL